MKLTIRNYKEATENIDFKKLPEAAREAHKEFDSFADFYDEDKDITEMLDNHFKIVEPFIKESSSSSKKTSSKRVKKETITVVKKQFKDGFEWAIIDSKTAKRIFNKDICEIFEVNFESQTEHAIESINDISENIEIGIEYKEAQKKFNIKLKANKRATSTKRKVGKKAVRKPHEVALMPLELKIIKRYLNMHSKRVTERQVSLLYKVIQKAATEKTIRKTSKYADEIKRIGNDLAQTYKEMNDTCMFEVPESMRTKLKALVDSYGVTPAVALIKRFINLYGNITIEKAKRLLTSIKNSKRNGKVSSKDTAYDRVNQVQKHLEEYLESDKLLVTNIQLNGLKGVAGLGK
jgi:hypothetical protein